MIGVVDGSPNAAITDVYGCLKPIEQYDSSDESLGGDDYREEPQPRLRPPVRFEEEMR